MNKVYDRYGGEIKFYWTSGKGRSDCYACSIVAVSSEKTCCYVHGFYCNTSSGASSLKIDESKME